MAGPAPHRQRGVQCSTGVSRERGMKTPQEIEPAYSTCEAHDAYGAGMWHSLRSSLSEAQQFEAPACGSDVHRRFVKLSVKDEPRTDIEESLLGLILSRPSSLTCRIHRSQLQVSTASTYAQDVNLHSDHES